MVSGDEVRYGRENYPNWTYNRVLFSRSGDACRFIRLGPIRSGEEHCHDSHEIRELLICARGDC